MDFEQFSHPNLQAEPYKSYQVQGKDHVLVRVKPGVPHGTSSKNSH